MVTLRILEWSLEARLRGERRGGGGVEPTCESTLDERDKVGLGACVATDRGREIRSYRHGEESEGARIGLRRVVGDEPLAIAEPGCERVDVGASLCFDLVGAVARDAALEQVVLHAAADHSENQR